MIANVIIILGLNNQSATLLPSSPAVSPLLKDPTDNASALPFFLPARWRTLNEYCCRIRLHLANLIFFCPTTPKICDLFELWNHFQGDIATWNASTPNLLMAKHSFSMVEYLTSLGSSFQLKHATGHSRWSSPTWLSTAPTPLSDPSKEWTLSRNLGCSELVPRKVLSSAL